MVSTSAKFSCVIKSPTLWVAVLACAAAGCAYARQLPPAAATDLTGRILARPVQIETLDFTEKTGRMTRFGDESQDGGKVVRLALERGPIDVPTDDIGRVVIRPTDSVLVRTGPDVRTLHLQYGPSRQPEPPGWFLPETRIDGWDAAVEQWPNSKWRYIPQASWIWAGKPRHHHGDETVLFRHDFDLPTTASLIAGYLDISADSVIESFFVNGTSIQLPKRTLVGEVSKWDITYLLQPGRNVIAARVTNGPGSGELNSAGLCYRLVCDVQTGDDDHPPQPAGTILLLANGDRLSGRLESVDLKQWSVRRGGQSVTIDSEWVALVLMNYGQTADPTVDSDQSKSQAMSAVLSPLKTLTSKIVPGRKKGRDAVSLEPRATVAWNRDIAPVRARQGVLMRNGDWVPGRIEGLHDNLLLVKRPYSDTFGIPVNRISLVQPNRPDPETQFLYHPSDFPYVVELRLDNNDRITGALETLGMTSIAITPHFTDSLRLPLAEVVSIDFKMNRMARHRNRLAAAWNTPPPLVAAIGESDRSLETGIDESIVTVQRTLQNLGVEMRWLRADEMVEAGRLTPERFPVLINFDQNGRFFYSISKEGDGFDAIRDYVNEGGTLLHLARGEPFSRAYVADRGRWRVRRPLRDLNEALMMNITSPGNHSDDGRPFDWPPNPSRHMFFQLNENSPFAAGLPSTVDVPMIADMRFRPITDDAVTTPARYSPVYRLLDDAGTDYGVAMAVIEYDRWGGKPNYGIYASHVLYEASYDGRSMIEYLLPKALSLSAGASVVPVANLAGSPGDPGSREASIHPDPVSGRSMIAPIPPP